MNAFLKGGVGALVLAGCAGSVTAVAANHVATVIVENRAAEVATYTPGHMTGTASPAFSSVNPKDSETFRVASIVDNVSSMQITYTAGRKRCQFAIGHAVISPAPTQWTKSAKSTGLTYANCSVVVEHIDMNTYNYTVRFSIQ